MSWNRFGVDPHLNFERKLKMMLHLFRILALTFCSKFQLIQDWYFLKGNSILYNFSRNTENQISTFSRPKMRFKLLLKIVTFFEHFFYFFEIFHWMYIFLYPIYFSKKFLLKLRKGISLLDKLEQIWCWFPFEILEENWRWCWIGVIFITCFVFWP